MITIIHTSTITNGALAECSVDPEVYRMSDDDPEKAVEAFRLLIRWLYSERAHNVEGLAARLIAAAYIFDPGLIENAKLRQIERDTRGRVNRSRVCQLAKEFRDEFKLGRTQTTNTHTPHPPGAKESL